MKDFLLNAATDFKNPHQLRRHLQETDHPDMWRRRHRGVNLIGRVSIGLVSLLQRAQGCGPMCPEPGDSLPVSQVLQ